MAIFRGTRRHAATEEDIFYIFSEGQRIADGVNPYARIHGSDMRVNQKYPTHLPGPYLLAAAAQTVGLRDFEDFMKVWRVLCAICVAASGWVILRLYSAQGLPFWGLALVSIFVLNRDTIFVMRIGQVEPPAVLFLLLAVALIHRAPRIAMLALGTSLALKHVAVLALPLILLEVNRPAGFNATLGNRAAPSRKTLSLWEALAWVSAIPVAISLPFLLIDAKGYILSVLFSLTRNPASPGAVSRSFDTLIGLTGADARLLLFLLVGIVTALRWRNTIGFHTALFLVFAIFCGFSSVYWPQYDYWPTAMVPLIALDFLLLANGIPPASREAGLSNPTVEPSPSVAGE